MTQRNIAITNFTSGQLSPTFQGRRDQQKYYSGARLIQNMIPLPSGGVTRRPPTGFISNLSFGTPNVVIPWQSSPDKSYIIVVDAGVSDIDIYIYKRSSGSTTQVHSFTSSLSTSGQYWTGASWAQSRDTMYIAVPNISAGILSTTDEPVLKLVNGSGGDTDWTLSQVQEVDGPFDEINSNIQFKMNPTAQSDSTVIKAENKAGTGLYYFTSADIGKLIRIRHNVDPEGETASWWGCAIIDGLTTGTDDGGGNYHSVDCTVQTFGDDNELSFGAASGSTDPAGTINWRLGAINDDNDYPTYVAFHENRLYYARDNRIFGSMANNFERHSPTVPDYQNNHLQTIDSAIDFKLLDLRAERINWLHSDQVLHMGTNTARYVIKSSDNLPLNPTNISVVPQSFVGVANVHPIFIDNLVYARYDREALLYADYNFRRDRYEDKNLNLHSDQILKAKVNRLAHTSYPFNIVWALLDDGTLASLTYDAEQEITAWAIHSIQGSTIEYMTSLIAENEKEVLYLVVKNTDNNVYSLQELDLTTWDYLQTSTGPETKLVDGYIDLSSVGSFTGKTHLTSYDNLVSIQDGINYPQSGTVDSSGDLTLDQTLTGDFHVGIPIATRLETFPIDLPIAGETQIGKMKSINEIEAIFHRSLSMSIQLSTSEYSEAVQFRHPDDPVAATPPLYSGSRTVSVSNVSEEEVYLIVTQQEEAPLTILALNARVEVEN